MNTNTPSPPPQYHPLPGAKQSPSTMVPTSPPTNPPTNPPSTSPTFSIVLSPDTHNLAQTHIRDTYARTQHPKHTTHIPHATLPLRLIHLHYLRTALHTPIQTTMPDPIIYHYLYLVCQLPTLQHSSSLHFHTNDHTYLLTRTSSHATPNDTFHLFPHHPHPYLLLSHTASNGDTLTTSYHSCIAPETSIRQRPRRKTTTLPSTDRTIIIHQHTTLHHQILVLLIATHLLLTTSRPQAIRLHFLDNPSTRPNIIRLILTTLGLQRAHHLWCTRHASPQLP